MKTGLAFLMLLVMSTGVQATELSWLTNYGDAMKLARTTAQPLLLVISRDDVEPASSDRLVRGQASQPLHDLLDAYVLCRIDANSSYGKRVAEAFRVTQFPHSVIIDKTTKKILYSRTGRATDDTWKATLAKYQAEAVFVTQPQATTRSLSRAYRQPYDSVQSATYGSRRPTTSNFRQPAFRQPTAFSFRQPAFCNT